MGTIIRKIARSVPRIRYDRVARHARAAKGLNMLPSISGTRRTLLFVALSLLTSGSPDRAGASSEFRGEVLLRITGAIDGSDGRGEAAFDLARLRALPHATFRTRTNWTEGVNTFAGVSLKDLLAAVGAHGASLHASAVNDYAFDIPASDATDGGPIVAYALDGHPLSIRDKGPLWIFYPFDSSTRYRTEVIYSRSIWQLTTLDVKP